MKIVDCDKFELASRIHKASITAMKYGMIDGAHHKQWVIDQMLQTLLGPEEYQMWLKEHNIPDYDPWDTGIAP